MLFNSWWHEPPNMKQSNTLQQIQYLNYITGIPVLYKILKKITILEQIFIPVLWSPSTGDPLSLCLNHKYLKSMLQKYILK